eukprot:1527386-Rhodomonas_salina.1
MISFRSDAQAAAVPVTEVFLSRFVSAGGMPGAVRWGLGSGGSNQWVGGGSRDGHVTYWEFAALKFSSQQTRASLKRSIETLTFHRISGATEPETHWHRTPTVT